MLIVQVPLGAGLNVHQEPMEQDTYGQIQVAIIILLYFLITRLLTLDSRLLGNNDLYIIIDLGNPCESCYGNPCENDGVCKQDESRDDGFKCECPVPFFGQKCERWGKILLLQKSNDSTFLFMHSYIC